MTTIEHFKKRSSIRNDERSGSFPALVRRMRTSFFFLFLISQLLYSQSFPDAKIVNSDRAENDTFGWSVAIYGDYAVVGAIGEDEDANGENSLSSAGSVYMYKKDGNGDWQEFKKIVPTDRESPDQFGSAVAISEDYLVVGAQLKYENGGFLGESGAAYIFQKDLGGTDNWGQLTKILPADLGTSDYFGGSAAIFGDYVIIGASGDRHDAEGNDDGFRAGSAYIFHKDQGGTNNWGEVKKLVASDRDDTDDFGYSVAITDEYAVVGAKYDENGLPGDDELSEAGSAYLFHKDEGGTDNWGEVKKLVASSRFRSAGFGWSVAISGEQVLVASRGRGIHVYAKDEGGADNWGEVQLIDTRGYAVSVVGELAIIGERGHDYDLNGENHLGSSGAAYLYERDETGSWTEIQKFVPESRDEDDNFGSSVAISASGEAIVSAIYDFDDAAEENPLEYAGSCYTIPVKIAQYLTFDAVENKAYGDASFELNASVDTGFEIVFSSSDPTIASVSGSTVTIHQVGEVELRANQVGDETYWPAQTAQEVIIDKATLNVTANDYNIVYGEDYPEFTLTYSGFVNGEDASVLDSEPEITFYEGETFPVGNYSIHVSGGAASNYYILKNDGTLTIEKAILTATPQDVTRKYGEYNPEEYEFSYEGFVFGETSNEVRIEPEGFSDTDETSNVGEYPISGSGGDADNYTIEYMDGTLTIEPADLSISVEDAEKTYGDENPTFTFHYDGFENDDDVSDLEMAPSASTTADEATAVGDYEIVPTGAIATNYDISYQSGILTINRAPLTAAVEDAEKTYGSENPAFSISYTGFVNEEDESVLDTQPTISTSANANSSVGTYDVVVSGAEGSNYDITHENGTLIINQALLLATADDFTITEDDAIPEFTITYSGFVNDDDESELDEEPIASTNAAAGTPGEFSIVLSGGMDNNYEYSYQDGVLTIEEVLGLIETEWTVYPNPTTKILNIEGADVVSIKIIGMDGKVVLSLSDTTRIDVQDLSIGKYMLMILDKSGRVTTHSFIKR